MNYKELKLSFTPFSEIYTDVMSSMLGEIGFESFIVEEPHLLAYVSEALYNKAEVDLIVKDFPLDTIISYEINDIEPQNWNEEWAKNNFHPIILGDECVILSTFHKAIPKTKYE